MPSSTVEQYIKIIYMETERSSRELVQMKSLADAMKVTPGTATTMVKHLAERGLIDYRPRRGVELTPDGRELALTMVRRHRLIESFLEQVLGYDWAEVHDDAERLEHAVSERFIERIDAYLGHPAFDPHGDPIPSHEGTVGSHDTRPLSSCRDGERIEIRRVVSSDNEFLKRMQEYRIMPGELFLLLENSITAGVLRLRHEGSGSERSIGRDLGTGIQVSPLS